MRAYVIWTALLLLVMVMVAGSPSVHATPAGATPPLLWQPPEPQDVPMPANEPSLRYEQHDPTTGVVTVVGIDGYHTTLLIGGEAPHDWYPDLADPYHIQVLLGQAQTGALRDHYAALGTVPGIQQTLVYTQGQQVRTITFDATSHTPAPPALWDLVAALRRIGEIPPLTGTPSGPPLPATISYEVAGNVVQVDAQGTARLYSYPQYFSGLRLTAKEVAAIQTQIAATHFFDLEPIYARPTPIGGQPNMEPDMRDPPEGNPDTDVSSLLVTQGGQSRVVRAGGSVGPPEFQRLLAMMSGIEDKIAARCTSPEGGDRLIGYQLSTPTRKWQVEIDTNGGIYSSINTGNPVANYMDPTDMHVLLQCFQQAQFDELGGWYPATVPVDIDQQHSVELWLIQDGRYKGIHAETSSQVPPGLEALLVDLADIQSQAQAAQQRAITDGTCPGRIHLHTISRSGSAPGMPTTGTHAPAGDLWPIAVLALALAGLGVGVRRCAAV